MTAFTVPTFTCRKTSRMEAIFLECVERDDPDWVHPDAKDGEYFEHNFIVMDADEVEFATFRDEVKAASCMDMIEVARAHVGENERRSRMEDVRKIYGFRSVDTVADF